MAYQPKSYRKFIAAAAAVAVVAPVVAPVASLAATNFTDVEAKYQEAVEFLVSKGIKGTTETTFGTQLNIKRVDAAVFVASALGLDTTSAPDAGFTDVPARAKGAVNALKAAKITDGKTDTTFASDQEITRGELAIWLQRAYKLDAGTEELAFTDVADRYKEAVSALVNYEITNGTSETTFGTTASAKRGDFALFIKRAADANVNVVPAIASVSAVDATTVKVNFNTAISNVDHTNFALNAGATVYKATLSSDKKSVELKLNNPLTSGAKYTVTATGIKNVSGKAAEELKSELVYTYDYGVTVQLERTSFDLGQTSKIILKDKEGKEVTPANIVVTINNENVITYNAGKFTASSKNEGSAEVVVKATLNDGTLVSNTFNVTVSDVKPVVENKGFTLVSDLNNAPKNTVEFNTSEKDTTLFNNGETAKVALFNTTDGNPDAAHVDFTKATVKSLNPTIATATVSGSVLEIAANNNKQTGSASFEITFADKTKKTITVDVKAQPVLKDVVASSTSVVLSDETKGSSSVDGVNQVTVELDTVDQYGDIIAQPKDSKITISTNEEGITLGEYDASAKTFTITSKKGKVVPSAQVKVNYFAKSTDTTPTLTENVNVKVVDVDATKAPVAIDVVPTSSTIDAFDVTYDDSTSLELVYELDGNGNRIGVSSDVSVDSLSSTLDNWLNLTGTTLGFDADSKFTMSQGGTANLKVKASGITVTETIDFTNSELVPHKVSVDTKPVAIKLAEGDSNITLEEILFGAIDADQLLTDAIVGSENDDIMAVKKNASNGGYKYNKPLVSVTDVKAGTVATGANVYGLPVTTVSGNAWDLNDTYGKFAIDATVVNAVDVSETSGTVTFAEGKDAGSFTIVLKSVKVTNDNNNDANLLAAPVSINVTLTK